MKRCFYLRSGLFLTILVGVITNASGQDNDLESFVSPFRKGNTILNLSNKLDFNWRNLKSDGEDAGKSNNYHINIVGTYFIMDNVGVGLGFHSERSRDIFDDIKETSVSNVGSINAVYGYSTGGIINLYGRAEVRGGVDKYNYDSPQYPEETKHSNFGLNFEIGAPMALGKGDGLYWTPFMAYDYNVLKDDEYKDVYSGLYFGTRLNLSLPCDEFAHGCSQVQDFSVGKYSKGKNVIGGYSQLKLNFGGAKYFNNGTDGYEEYGKSSISDGLLAAEFYHYFFDNIAAGGEFRLRTSSEKDKESDNRQSSFSWMIKPTIMGNVPVDGDLNNAFGFAGFGLGTASDKTTYTGNSVKDSEFRSSLFFGAGYNVHFSRNFSVVPTINYTFHSSKEKYTDIKSTRNGVEAAIYCWFTF